MSAAVHTALPAGEGYLTLEIKVNFIRPVFAKSGEIMAEGTLVSSNQHVATSEGRVIDVNGRLCATGTATCLVFELPGVRGQTSSATENSS